MTVEMSTTFPSATTPALTSLASGAWPAEHGALGWFLYLENRDITVTALPFIERLTDRDLGEVGVSPREIFDWDPLLNRFDRGPTVVLPAEYTTSVYTAQVSGAADVLGYERIGDAINTVAARVRRASAPTYTYLYTATVDVAAHEDGIDAPSVRAATEALDAAVERLALEIGPSARIVLTADHGLRDIPDRDKVLLEADDPILDLLLTPPSGEPRVPLFHVRPGHGEEFTQRFRQRWGDRFALLSREDVEDLRLLGPDPLTPIARAHLGDFMAVSADDSTLLFVPDGFEEVRGFHGGLTPEEMLVPLIVT